MEHWPGSLAVLGMGVDDMSCTESIPCTLEGVAENIVIERYRGYVTDRARRLGIFSGSHDEQTHVSLRFHGFIKRSDLQGYGNWNG